MNFYSKSLKQNCEHSAKIANKPSENCEQTEFQQTRVYPYSLGAGSARPNPKMGTPDPENPLFLGFSVLRGGLRPWSQTMVSEGARPWGRGRSGDCEGYVNKRAFLIIAWAPELCMSRLKRVGAKPALRQSGLHKTRRFHHWAPAHRSSSQSYWLSQNCEQALRKLRTQRILNKRAFLISGCAKGAAKGSCGETDSPKGCFGESVSSLPP